MDARNTPFLTIFPNSIWPAISLQNSTNSCVESDKFAIQIKTKLSAPVHIMAIVKLINFHQSFDNETKNAKRLKKRAIFIDERELSCGSFLTCSLPNALSSAWIGFVQTFKPSTGN